MSLSDKSQINHFSKKVVHTFFFIERTKCMYKVYTTCIQFLLYCIIYLSDLVTILFNLQDTKELILVGFIIYVRFLRYSTFNTSNVECDVLNVRSVCTKSILLTSNFSCIASYTFTKELILVGFIIYVRFLRYSTFNTSNVECDVLNVQSLYYLHPIYLVLHHIPF